MKKHLEKNIKETQQFLEDKIFKLYIANTPLSTKGNFSVDKKNYSSFWQKNNDYFLSLPPIGKRTKKEKIISEKIKNIIDITKKIFLKKHSAHIYSKLTYKMDKFINLDDLVFNANKIVPFITPDKNEIKLENSKKLKDKEGIEIGQALLISSVLQLEKEGNHLCHSLLLPSLLAKEAEGEFNKNKKFHFDGATVEK